MRLASAMLFAMATSSLVATPTAQIRYQSFALMAGGEHHAIAYDSVQDRMFRFGGRYGSNTASYGTWEFVGTAWVHRPVTVSPPARLHHTMTFDPVRGVMVVFGGQDQAGNALGDTWLWDGDQWSPSSPSVSPPARIDHAAAFDAERGHIVLFGGGRDVGGTFTPLQDTWTWDGTTWTKLTPPVSPPARFGHAMAYDSQRRRIVLFGGTQQRSGQILFGTIEKNDGPALGDTWEWDGTTWLPRSPTSSPAPRSQHSMAYHEARGRTVVFGGRDGYQCIGGGPWEWDGIQWREVNAFPLSAPGSAMAYDAARRRIVWYSGRCVTPATSYWIASAATWAYLSATPALQGPIGAGCAGTPGQLALAPHEGSLPWSGDTFELDLGPVATGAVALGVIAAPGNTWGPFTLPLDLGPLGAPGCRIYAALQALVPLSVVAGQARWSLPIPPNARLVGQRFIAQGILVGDPANPGNVVTSNGVLAEIGAR